MNCIQSSITVVSRRRGNTAFLRTNETSVKQLVSIHDPSKVCKAQFMQTVQRLVDLSNIKAGLIMESGEIKTLKAFDVNILSTYSWCEKQPQYVKVVDHQPKTLARHQSTTASVVEHFLCICCLHRCFYKCASSPFSSCWTITRFLLNLKTINACAEKTKLSGPLVPFKLSFLEKTFFTGSTR